MSDGGQAFPSATGGGEFGFRPVSGMTLRDYFAGQALAGLSSDREWRATQSWKVACVNEAMVIESYAISDAMLAARNEGQE